MSPEIMRAFLDTVRKHAAVPEATLAAIQQQQAYRPRGVGNFSLMGGPGAAMSPALQARMSGQMPAGYQQAFTAQADKLLAARGAVPMGAVASSAKAPLATVATRPVSGVRKAVQGAGKLVRAAV